MDIYIRSQDKLAMSKYDLLIAEETPTGEYMFIADHYKCFGTYKTRARTLEILDEIQSILEPNGLKGSFVNIVGINTYVYEMPKE